MDKQYNICVFLSASEVPQKYEKSAIELAQLIIDRGHFFVYGGSERGLMKKAADEVTRLGGKIISVVSEEFREVWREDVEKQIECTNIPERKKKMLEVSDAIIVLPGGTGTLDEFTEIMETKKWGEHNKPIVLINTSGYWNSLLEQYERMQSEGFLGKPINKLIFIASNPIEAIDYLDKVLKT